MRKVLAISLILSFVLAFSACDLSKLSGTWTGTYNDGSTDRDIVLVIGQAGAVISGSGILDNTSGYTVSGEYQDPDFTVSCVLSNIEYIFTGTVPDENSVSGTYERYESEDLGESGTFSLSRQ